MFKPTNAFYCKLNTLCKLCYHVKTYRYLSIRKQYFSTEHDKKDWKYDKNIEYFDNPSKIQKIIISTSDNDESFESPYAKWKKQKNPTISQTEQSEEQQSEQEEHNELLSSLQLFTRNDDDALTEQEKKENEIAKYHEWKSKQTDTKEYIHLSDYYQPRTLQDLKNWNIKQNEMEKYQKQQHENIKKEEELRLFDLNRDGHIIQALKTPDIAAQINNEDSLALSNQHKFDFSGEPTYVMEGAKLFKYYIEKYGIYFTKGFIKISIVSSIGLYLCLYQNYVTQTDIIDFLQQIQPFSYSAMNIAQSSTLNSVWWNTFYGSFITPIIILSGIYAKYKGAVWEYKELKKKPDNIDLKTDVLTLQNKGNNISHNNLIHEIALIKERRAKRISNLAPLEDVIDITATFNPNYTQRDNSPSMGTLPFTPKNLVNKGYKLKKFVKNHGVTKGFGLFLSSSHSELDPRRASSTQKFGLFKLQTRLDEFGRVIPGWQRQKTTLWIAPTIIVFLFFPPIGDWLLGWTL